MECMVYADGLLDGWNFGMRASESERNLKNVRQSSPSK